jgi:hypothetical protein
MPTTRRRKTTKMHKLLETSLGPRVGQLRAAPVRLGPRQPPGILLAYCADFDVDPWVEMFFFPSDTLKLAVMSPSGELLWRGDLGPGVVPGVWFCPVLPFDLDCDGADELWFVGNTDADHPLGLSHYVLERVDPITGATTGQWPWPHLGPEQSLSHTFRNFLIGGQVMGQPVLVTAQGTYGDMYLQTWDPGIRPRWQRHIRADEPGARGSHMCPVVDINGDGVDELMWGERCISLDTGAELFCADRHSYSGHSDVVQPLLKRDSGRWLLYTCRESDGDSAPRVAAYDAAGARLWGQLDVGHVDMGWAARIHAHGVPTAVAIRIGHKSAGPSGRFHQGVEQFVFDGFTGEPRTLLFSAYRTVPVDVNGDGIHELVRGLPGGDGALLDGEGRELARLGGTVAAASKLMDHPGEQVLCYYPDGTLVVWGDANAIDSQEAHARYRHPYYASAQRLGAVGYNLTLLAGL